MQPKRTTGQKIADARAELGRRRGERLTQQWLADAVGVQKGTVAKWETDVQFPSEENLRSLASALEVAVEDLLPDPPNPRVAVELTDRLWAEIDRINALDIPEDHKTLRIDAVVSALRAVAWTEAEEAAKERARVIREAEQATRARADALREFTQLRPEDVEEVQPVERTASDGST